MIMHNMVQLKACFNVHLGYWPRFVKARFSLL